MPTASTKKEQIDERILRILGLNPEEVEMDYITYHNALREAMVRGAKSLSPEEQALLVNERRRIRGNKGRFKVKTKKVKIDASSVKSPIKEKRKMLPASTKITESPIKEKRKMLPGAEDKEKIKEKGGSLIKIVNTQGKLLSKLAKTLDSNAKEEKKIQSKKNKLIKRKRDEKKKDKKEEDLEKKKGGLSKLTKAADKILAPVKGLFERIFDYLKLTALNFVVGSVYKWFTDPANKEKIEKIKNFFTSIGDWFQDPGNQKKLSTIGRFLKDNWKVILGIGGVILLWNSGIGAVVTAIGFAIKGIGLTLLLLAKNPLIAAAIGIGAGLTYLANKSNKQTEPTPADTDAPVTAPALANVEETRQSSTTTGRFDMEAGQGYINNNPVSLEEYNNFSNQNREEKRYNKGGMVPVMLTKGEYVVPPEQVDKIGVNKLTSINNIGNYNRGGNVYGDEFNLGGLVPGRGPNVDTVKTLLPEGSYVIQRPSVDALGAENIPGMIASLGGLSGGSGNRGGTGSQGSPSGQQRQQKQSSTNGNPLLNLLGMTPTGMALKGATSLGTSLGEGVMSFGSSVKEKGLGNATTDAAGGLFGNIKGFMDEKGITDTVMMHPLAKMGAFGFGKGKEIFNNIKGFADEKGITDAAMMHPLAKMGMFGMNKFMNLGKDSTRNIIGESSNSQEENMKRVMALPPEMRKAVLEDMNRSVGKVKKSSSGSIRDFLKLNTGGEVSGSAGVGNKIVEGAKKIIGYKKGVGDRCADTTRAALAAAGHPAAKKRTQVGDLDTPKGTAYNGPSFAASFGGSDMGKIITQKSQIKPGDIILWRALRDINPSKGITKGAITHVGIAADNGLKNQYDHNTSSGFHYRPHWDSSSGTKWFAGVRLGSSGGMLPPELPAGGVSGGGGGGSGGSGDGRDSNSSPFASSGFGMLLKDLGFTNDQGGSIGSPTTNSKMKDVSSTSPTDIGEAGAGGETTATVSSLSPSNETKDMRQGPAGRATETMVRQGVNSVTLYDWSYEKIYGIQGA